jgi:RNA polymerase sigma-70 factor (ECF subfamily)
MDEEFDVVLAAAREGAEWAWTRLYRSLAGPLLGYLRLRGAHEPEDLLGEVFLQLARNLPRFQGTERQFRSWAFTVAHNRTIDERRKRRRHPVDPIGSFEEHHEVTGDTTVEAALERVHTEGVARLLDDLAPAQREVLLLRIVAGLTLPECAAVTGRSVGAVKALQRRGLIALARRFPEGGIPE